MMGEPIKGKKPTMAHNLQPNYPTEKLPISTIQYQRHGTE